MPPTLAWLDVPEKTRSLDCGIAAARRCFGLSTGSKLLTSSTGRFGIWPGWSPLLLEAPCTVVIKSWVAVFARTLFWTRVCAAQQALGSQVLRAMAAGRHGAAREPPNAHLAPWRH